MRHVFTIGNKWKDSCGDWRTNSIECYQNITALTDELIRNYDFVEGQEFLINCDQYGAPEDLEKGDRENQFFICIRNLSKGDRATEYITRDQLLEMREGQIIRFDQGDFWLEIGYY